MASLPSQIPVPSPQRQPVPLANGVFKSRVFPGLWLDTASLLKRDLAAVLRVIQQGIASPEHTAFAEQLRVK